MSKKITHIIVVLLSVLVIQAGAGVAVYHHCCSGAKVQRPVACNNECGQCVKTVHLHKHHNVHCGDRGGCHSFVYREILVQHSPEDVLPLPSCPFLFYIFPTFFFFHPEFRYKYVSEGIGVFRERRLWNLFSVLIL